MNIFLDDSVEVHTLPSLVSMTVTKIKYYTLNF
jgi:hypothetical protein